MVIEIESPPHHFKKKSNIWDIKIFYPHSYYCSKFKTQYQRLQKGTCANFSKVLSAIENMDHSFKHSSFQLMRSIKPNFQPLAASAAFVCRYFWEIHQCEHPMQLCSCCTSSNKCPALQWDLTISTCKRVVNITSCSVHQNRRKWTCFYEYTYGNSQFNI